VGVDVMAELQAKHGAEANEGFADMYYQHPARPASRQSSRPSSRPPSRSMQQRNGPSEDEERRRNSLDRQDKLQMGDRISQMRGMPPAGMGMPDPAMGPPSGMPPPAGNYSIPLAGSRSAFPPPAVDYVEDYYPARRSQPSQRSRSQSEEPEYLSHGSYSTMPPSMQPPLGYPGASLYQPLAYDNFAPLQEANGPAGPVSLDHLLQAPREESMERAVTTSSFQQRQQQEEELPMTATDYVPHAGYADFLPQGYEAAVSSYAQYLPPQEAPPPLVMQEVPTGYPRGMAAAATAYSRAKTPYQFDYEPSNWRFSEDVMAATHPYAGSHAALYGPYGTRDSIDMPPAHTAPKRSSSRSRSRPKSREPSVERRAPPAEEAAAMQHVAVYGAPPGFHPEFGFPGGLYHPGMPGPPPFYDLAMGVPPPMHPEEMMETPRDGSRTARSSTARKKTPKSDKKKPRQWNPYF